MKKVTVLLASLALAGLASLAVSGGLRAAKVEVGAPAPTFDTVDSKGKTETLAAYKGKYVVLEWSNLGCPFVQKHYKSGNMQALQKKYTEKGVAWLTVYSSAKGQQGYYTPDQLNEVKTKWKMSSTALIPDADGTLGHLYGAKNTPTMFVINPEGKVIYMGGIDDTASPDPADIPKSKNYVAAALDEAMAGKAVSTPRAAPYGCSVKYGSE